MQQVLQSHEHPTTDATRVTCQSLLGTPSLTCACAKAADAAIISTPYTNKAVYPERLNLRNHERPPPQPSTPPTRAHWDHPCGQSGPAAGPASTSSPCLTHTLGTSTCWHLSERRNTCAAARRAGIGEDQTQSPEALLLSGGDVFNCQRKRRAEHEATADAEQQADTHELP